jgi:hypothetical protein
MMQLRRQTWWEWAARGLREREPLLRPRPRHAHSPDTRHWTPPPHRPDGAPPPASRRLPQARPQTETRCCGSQRLSIRSWLRRSGRRLWKTRWRAWMRRQTRAGCRRRRCQACHDLRQPHTPRLTWERPTWNTSASRACNAQTLDSQNKSATRRTTQTAPRFWRTDADRRYCPPQRSAPSPSRSCPRSCPS